MTVTLSFYLLINVLAFSDTSEKAVLNIENIMMRKKLGSYLAVTIGTGCCTASMANGAVTFFGKGARGPDTSPPTPDALTFMYNNSYGAVYFSEGAMAAIGFSFGVVGYFTNGSSLVSSSGVATARYSFMGDDLRGATLGLSLIHI